MRISSCPLKPRIFAWIAFVAALAINAEAATISVSPSRDNTLYENDTGAESSGLGDSLFVGRTGANDGTLIRRAVLAFDLSAIPAGSTINSVTLTLFLSQGAASSFGTSVSLFQLRANWGEGTSFGSAGNPGASTTGDATWRHRFFSTQLWLTPGGDFDSLASATTTIGSSFLSYSWSGTGLVQDVQEWIGNPAANFGWILRGNEDGSQTALRFSSRESTTTANRPQLTINYTIPEPAVATLLPAGALGVLFVRRRR
jgi:hypothetical protein